MPNAGTITINLEAEIAKFNKKMDSAAAKVQQTTSKIDKSFNLIKKGTAALAIGAVVMRSVQSVRRFVDEVAEAGDQIAKMSQKIGVSTDFFQELAYASELSGTNLNSVAVGVRTLSKYMYDASKGTGEAKVAFDDLNISVMDMDGKLKSARDVMLDVADKFSQMEDGAKKTAMAQKMFGRSGSEMIPMLNEGRAGLEAMNNQLDKYHGRMSDELIKSSEDYKDAMFKLSTAWDGFKYSLMDTGVLDAAVQALENMASAIASITESLPKLSKWLGKTLDSEGTTYHDYLANAYWNPDGTPKGKPSKKPVDAVVDTIEVDITKISEGLDLTNIAKKISDVQFEIALLESGFSDAKKEAIGLAGGMSLVGADLQPIEGAQESVGELTALYEKLNSIQDKIAKEAKDASEAQANRDRLASMADQLTKTYEPITQYKTDITELNDLLAAGLISTTTYARAAEEAERQLIQANRELLMLTQEWSAGAAVAFQDYADMALDAAGNFYDAFSNAISNLEDEFVAFATTTKFDFDSLIASIEADLARIAYRQGISGPLSRWMAGTGAESGGVGGMLGSLFGGFRENGGDVSAGRAYVVGENEAEIFTPGTSGTITPISQITGMIDEDGANAIGAAVARHMMASGGSRASFRQHRGHADKSAINQLAGVTR